MIFVYPYKRKDSDFLIQHSIRCVRKHYPDSRIYTVGDKVDGADHIEHKDSFIRKGCNVTSKILHASKLFDEFIYMNDDFFINERFDFDYTYQGFENLERKEGKASIAWNQAVDNSVHLLESLNRPIITYECHQPIKINSKILQSVFDEIDWTNADHFLKSLYLNMNPPIKYKSIENVKLIEPNIKRAELLLTMYGCFSVGQGFLTEVGSNFIKKLT